MCMIDEYEYVYTLTHMHTLKNTTIITFAHVHTHTTHTDVPLYMCFRMRGSSSFAAPCHVKLSLMRARMSLEMHILYGYS
jgi:hypothetical protein